MATGRSASVRACAATARSATVRQRSSSVYAAKRAAFIRATDVPDGSAPS